ncbi:MAG: M42 family metallopeptidase [Chloroflexi bacterium]|nr:M42 family metallopeptidase [Chloroflexota bacterium]
MIETIRKLVEAYGPSGYEDEVREIILEEIDGLYDDVQVDALGNLIAWRRSGKDDASRVMLSSHMDEIGLIVSHVDEQGFLRFSNIGGLYPYTLVGNRVRFKDGTVGVIMHEIKDYSTSSAPKMDQLFIDVSDGSDSPSLRIGDTAVMDYPLVQRGDRLSAKSMDDRIACAVQVEVMRALKDVEGPNDIAFVFSVQEEVGLRGARTAAFSIEPDLGIAIDVTRAGDTPKASTLDQGVSLGKGPAIKIMDSRFLANPEVIQLMDEAAARTEIATQREVLTGGTTDANAIQLVRAGVKSGCLSIPCRYVHSVSETVDLKDVKGAVTLLADLLSQPITL